VIGYERKRVRVREEEAIEGGRGMMESSSEGESDEVSPLLSILQNILKKQ
jgi:hypothetical protein